MEEKTEEMIWRRFIILTSNNETKDRLEEILRRSNLSRDDLMMILKYMAINPDIS